MISLSQAIDLQHLVAKYPVKSCGSRVNLVFHILFTYIYITQYNEYSGQLTVKTTYLIYLLFSLL